MHRSWNVYVCLGFLLVLLVSCQAQQPATEAEHEQSVSITKWTTHTELFVEFTPFTVGKETPLAVHLTDLRGFQPVSTEVLTTALESAERQGVTVRTEVPTVPGIYRPVLKPEQPGAYRLVFRRLHHETQELLDTIEAGDVVVTTAEENSAPTEKGAEEQGVTFLKEQQWRIAFATEEVTPRELLATLTLHAEVKPAAGGEAHITAPLGGRVLAPGKGAPVLGHTVEPGEPLALVVPLHPAGTNRTELESGVKTAQAELAAAEQELTRVPGPVPRPNRSQAESRANAERRRCSAGSPGGDPLATRASGYLSGLWMGKHSRHPWSGSPCARRSLARWSPCR